MFTPSRLTKLALIVVALSAMAGCGKAAPLQRDPALVDDALTRAPIQSAGESVAAQQQQARDAEARRAENAKVSAPGNDKGG